MVDYEITGNTCALVGINDKETEIIERGKRFTIPRKAKEVLKHSCEFYGSTLAGRIKGSQVQLGMKYKLPIIIESSNELIFFPTVSPRLEECSWISLKNIKNYEETQYGVSIEFYNNQKIMLPISLASLEVQIFRATKLMLIARNRRKMLYTEEKNRLK